MINLSRLINMIQFGSCVHPLINSKEGISSNSLYATVIIIFAICNVNGHITDKLYWKHFSSTLLRKRQFFHSHKAQVKHTRIFIVFFSLLCFSLLFLVLLIAAEYWFSLEAGVYDPTLLSLAPQMFWNQLFLLMNWSSAFIILINILKGGLLIPMCPHLLLA